MPHLFRLTALALAVSLLGSTVALAAPAELPATASDSAPLPLDDLRTFAVRKKPGADELLARLRNFRGKLPADFKFSRDEANERG